MNNNMLIREIECFNRQVWYKDFSEIHKIALNNLYNNTNVISDENGEEISRKILEYSMESHSLRMKINHLFRKIIKCTNKDNSSVDSDLAYRLSKLTI